MTIPYKSTTLFTAGLNVFGLLIIEFVKLIENNVPPRNSDSIEALENMRLLWTGVFQCGLLIIGLVFLIGRVKIVLRWPNDRYENQTIVKTLLSDDQTLILFRIY